MADAVIVSVSFKSDGDSDTTAIPHSAAAT
jgi:hypothetical protein